MPMLNQIYFWHTVEALLELGRRTRKQQVEAGTKLLGYNSGRIQKQDLVLKINGKEWKIVGFLKGQQIGEQ